MTIPTLYPLDSVLLKWEFKGLNKIKVKTLNSYFKKLNYLIIVWLQLLPSLHQLNFTIIHSEINLRILDLIRNKNPKTILSFKIDLKKKNNLNLYLEPSKTYMKIGEKNHIINFISHSQIMEIFSTFSISPLYKI